MQEGKITRFGMIVEPGVEYLIVPRTNGIAMCITETNNHTEFGVNATLFDDYG
jgi:hypothetical protein